MGQEWTRKLAALGDLSKQQKAAISGRLLTLDDAKANGRGFFRVGDDDDVCIVLKSLLPHSTGKSHLCYQALQASSSRLEQNGQLCLGLAR